jgi:hypothetical protein
VLVVLVVGHQLVPHIKEQMVLILFFQLLPQRVVAEAGRVTL